MVQKYFEYNGKQYPTGTVVMLYKNSNKKEKQKYIFVSYDPQYNVFHFKSTEFNKKFGTYPHFMMYRNNFYNWGLAEITNEVDMSLGGAKIVTVNDANCGGLLYGWIWYIFLMVISTIFVDRVMMWIIWSVIFFAYRSSVREKEGTRIEW